MSIMTFLVVEIDDEGIAVKDTGLMKLTVWAMEYRDGRLTVCLFHPRGLT